jgi:hypothetical protein
MMTGANIGADSYGRNRDEDYQAESPAPSNQVCPRTLDAEGIVSLFQLPYGCEQARACCSLPLREPASTT